MGMQDRDYYWEHKAEQAKAEADKAKPKSPVFDGGGDTGPPDLFGGSWHWATKVLVWLAVVGLLFLAFKVFERKRIERLHLEKQIAQQQALIEEQKRQIEALKPKPRIDFFK